MTDSSFIIGCSVLIIWVVNLIRVIIGKNMTIDNYKSIAISGSIVGICLGLVLIII